MAAKYACSRGWLVPRAPRAAAASIGKLIWMSAALKAAPANHALSKTGVKLDFSETAL